MRNFITLLFVLFYSIANADVSLPQIGQESSYQIDREERLGLEFRRHLIASNRIINDPLVNYYLNEIMTILLQGLNNNKRNYIVEVINDRRINAFAAPGGFIGMNLGLLMEAKTESQLAGVLAHEIAHVELRHILQWLEKKEEVDHSLWASFLLAIIVGHSSAVENKEEAVEALIFGGAASASQAMINFTRENEYEADRKGLEILRESGFSTKGMGQFFKLLEGRVGADELTEIEYLRTHPISENRVAEVEPINKKNNSMFIETESLDYEFFRIYLNSLVDYGFVTKKDNGVLKRFEEALEFYSNNQFEQAELKLSALNKENEDNIWIAFVRVKVLVAMNNFDQTIDVLNASLATYSKNSMLLKLKMDVLLLKGENEEALGIALFILNKNANNQSVRYALVEIYNQLGLEWLSREVEADYHQIEGNDERSKVIYKWLINEVDDAVLKARVIEKLKKIESKSKGQN